MKVGVVLPVEGPIATRDNVLQIARLAEELGYHSIWATDRILYPRANPDGYPYAAERGNAAFRPGRMWLEPMTTLALAAAVTERVQLGTHVLVLPYRHPTVLAQQVASLQYVSNGRVLLGVGVGWMREEFTALGRSPTTRGADTDNAIEKLRCLWADRGAMALAAHSADVAAASILVGGNSTPALTRAARLGDGWLGVDLDPAETRVATRELLDHAAAAGRDREDFTLSMRRRVEAGNDADLDDGIRSLVDDFDGYAGAGIDLMVVDFLMTPDIAEALRRLAAVLAERGGG